MKPDVIVICESWLSDNVPNEYLVIPHFSEPFRQDRSDGRKGGGVLVYVRQHLSSANVTPTSYACTFVEQVWIQISTNLLLISLYVPPSIRTSIQNELKDDIVEKIDQLLSRQPDLKIIIAGDLNQLSIASLEQDLNIENLVDLPTRGPSVLDKILVDKSVIDRYLSPVIVPNLGSSDHHGVFLRTGNVHTPIPTLHKVYDFRESNLHQFYAILTSFPWAEFYRSDDCLDDKCDVFHQVLEQAMSTIPFEYVPMTEKDKPWITPRIKLLINKRYDAFRNKKYDIYQHYKEKVKKAIDSSKQSWTSRSREKPAGFWNVVKNLTNKKRTGQIDKLIDSFNSPIEAVEAINLSFAKNFTDEPAWDKFHIRDSGVDWNIDISLSSVLQCLQKLKIQKATGSDGLPARILKLAATVLAPPLTHLFCLSISSRTFPKKWKTADVVPIPKVSNPKLEDLRPISKLPICSKVLEHLVLQSVKRHLIAHYGHNQFGFRPRSSTLHAHISIQEFITERLDDTDVKDVAIISFDMAKAFDKLNHKALLTTLERIHLPQKFIRWCKSYLQNRQQCVVLNRNIRSSSSTITSGVPQGSVLAPYLFATHMGSLAPLSPLAHMTKYADDVVILLPLKRDIDTDTALKMEVENMSNWCSINGLELNRGKTKVMFVKEQRYLRNLLTIYPVASEVKVLGIVYECQLKWNLEISKRYKKASQRLFVLRKLKGLLYKSELLRTHNNFVLSLLEYCAPLFLGISSENSSKLERVQRRAHKIICGLECSCDQFPPLSERRKHLALKCFLAMQQDDNILNRLFPDFLPSGKRLIVPFCRTSLRLSSFIPSCILLYNSL